VDWGVVAAPELCRVHRDLVSMSSSSDEIEMELQQGLKPALFQGHYWPG
jgi:hypothetical protein